MKYFKSFIALLLAAPVLIITAFLYMVGKVTDTSSTMQLNLRTLKFWRIRVAISLIVDGIGLAVMAVLFAFVYAFGWLDDWANGTLEMDAELRAREG